MLNSLFPPLKWIKGYSFKLLVHDAVSGLTLAAYAIPVSLAYATLAGLPPQYGIYGYLIGGLIYGIFGTGMQLSVGPTSAISLMIGTTIAGMANGDVQRWADIASLTALLVAIISLFAYLARLNSIVNFISESILLGFKAGAALTIAVTQLPKLFGLHGGGESFFERISMLVSQLPGTNITVLSVGLSAIILLTAGERFFPGRPTAILIVVSSIILISTTSLQYSGITVVGNLPSGLPNFRIPVFSISDVDNVMPLAFACFLLAYIENVSSARTLAQQKGYEIDSSQELLALAATNATVAFGQGYPVSGGLSQSAVNSTAGARTPFSLVFASAVIAICLLFLTGLIRNLPDVVLAAVLLVAISSLIDFSGLKRLWKVSRLEFSVAIIAFAGVIVFGILKGVIIAAIASIVLLIRAVSDPHVAFLGRIPGTKRYTDINRHPDNETIPGILLFRVEAAVLYFNVENIRKKVLAEVASHSGPLQTIIWDLSTSPYVDIAGAKLIKKLYLEFSSQGISLKIAEAHADVREMLRAEEIENMFGHISRKISIDDLVSESTIKIPD